MGAPFLSHVYRVGTSLALPFAARATMRRLRDHDVDAARAREKLGHATQPRAVGPLIWFHAASIGESMSVLSLITRMGQMQPDAHFLITSGTATSAQMIARRIPPRCIHQFAALDAPGPVGRFLDHWHPDAAIFVESELWPNTLRMTHARGVPLALVNARLSQRSMARWAKRPALARHLTEVFSLILTQNEEVAQGMIAMQAPPDRVVAGVNLKSMSEPLPVDQVELTRLRDCLSGRPVWVASSTHPGEEEIILAAHKTLLKSQPDLCLILAPRHPERSAQVAGLITAAGLDHTCRSQGAMPEGQVYLADTLGELGLWYTLADVVFLGGSLRPIGGHNPFEVAQAGVFTLSGTHVANFAETYAEMQSAGAAKLIESDALTGEVAALLQNADRRAAARQAARAFAAGRADTLDDIATRLLDTLEIAP